MRNDPQDSLIEFLSRSDSYQGRDIGPIAAVEIIRTHASVIFLVGERAFKLKRAVTYSYLDYATLASREAACRAEIDLNRRTAPSIYLGTVPVTRSGEGRFALGGAGEIVDWLVEMRRFGQDALFSSIAAARTLTPDLLLRLTQRIIDFHQKAETRLDQGGSAGIAAVIEINEQNLRKTLQDAGSRAKIDQLQSLTLAAFKHHRALLDERRHSGRVRQCHGDLHLGNICLFEGEPTLFDCIEFSPLIACIDVLYDLAFLLMDLRLLGYKREAAGIFNRYLDLGGDEEGTPLMPLFLSLRAAVRAHVTGAAIATAEAGKAEELRDKAIAYLDHALEALQPAPARLVAIGGLSGSGKSSVAASIAHEIGAPPGARLLRSDMLRKRLFKVAPEERLPEAAYTPEIGHKVYRQLYELAERALAAGHSVIIDAVSARRAERAAMRDLAQRLGVPFNGIWLEGANNILRQRIGARQKDASDATAAVLDHQLGYDLGTMDWARVDAGRPLAGVAADVLQRLALAD